MLRKSRKAAQVLILLFLLGYSVFLMLNLSNEICFTERWKMGFFTSSNIKTSKAKEQFVINSPIKIGSSHPRRKRWIVLGEPRKSKGFLSVGYLHTEPCNRSDRLERSVDSLVSKMNKRSLELTSIIIVLRNCSEEYTSMFLNRIKLKYNYLLQLNILKIVKPSQQSYMSSGLRSNYWENLTSYDTNYVKKAKLLVNDMSFSWKSALNESQYFIQFTDHVIVEGDIISHLLEYVKALTDTWLWADTFTGDLTGRFYQTKDFPAMLEYIDLLGNQMPINMVLNFYRQFRYSHPATNILPLLPLRDEFFFTADNPSAKVTTSLVYGGGYSVQDIYDMKRGYFWAKTPKKGDYIIVELKDAVQINRVLIETGSHLDEDIIPGGSLSVVLVAHYQTSKEATIHRKTNCFASNYTKLADFTAPSLNLYLTKMTIKCIKVVITPVPFKDLQFWVRFRTIAVFTNDVIKV